MTQPAQRVLLVNDHPEGSGIGRYVRSLYSAMVAKGSREVCPDLLLQNVSRTTAGDQWQGAAERDAGSRLLVQPRPRWAKQRGYGAAYRLNGYYRFPRRIPPGYDLYHITSQMIGQSARQVRPVVVTVHDLVAVRFGANHPALASWLGRRHLAAVREADWLIFISEHTRQDYLSLYEYPVEQTTVIHHGVSQSFVPGDRMESRKALGLPQHGTVLLHVGSEERRKNVETLLEALALLARSDPDVLLVRVGGQSSRCQRLIARLGLRRNVRYLGGLPEPVLVQCYQAADAFVFPSLLEGFGLPVLEALRSGCPVVASEASSIPEITGEAAVLVDPHDAAGMANGVSRILSDTAFRKDLWTRGVARATAFSWERAAELTLGVYRRVLLVA